MADVPAFGSRKMEARKSRLPGRTVWALDEGACRIEIHECFDGSRFDGYLTIGELQLDMFSAPTAQRAADVLLVTCTMVGRTLLRLAGKETT